MANFYERASEKEDEVRIAIADLIGEYNDKIKKLEKKLEELCDREDLWVVFLKDPKSMSMKEVGEMFKFYEKRALALSAYLQGEEDKK